MKPLAPILILLCIAASPVVFAADPGSTQATRPQVNVDDSRVIKMNKALGQKRPDFALKDLEGKLHNADQWNGKVLVVNFWATWCPPCRKEMPMFVELQKQYADRGLQFVGIALDDPTMVQDFADNFLVNYPILIGDKSALDLTRKYGNYLGALPYTVIVDRKGIIRYVRPGKMSHKQAEAAILKRL